MESGRQNRLNFLRNQLARLELEISEVRAAIESSSEPSADKRETISHYADLVAQAREVISELESMQVIVDCAMTTLEYTCPECGKGIVVSAPKISAAAWAEPETTITLECRIEDGGCGWRGQRLLEQGVHVHSPTRST